MDLDRQMIDQALMTTRGVRMRLDLEREVTDQVLLDCIDVAEQAPTGGHNGSRRWMVVRDQSTKDRLAELYLDAGASYVIEAADRIRDTDHPNATMMQGAKRLAENIANVPALVIPTIIGIHDGSGRPGLFDSVIQAAWSFMVALRARGLGTVWTTMYLNKRDEVAELLDIPPGNTQICLFPVAYTKGTDFKPTSRRYPAREITYFDRYSRTLEGVRSNSATLADGHGVVVEAEIKAPPSAVWPIVTDISVPAQFSTELQRAVWRDDVTEPGVGSVFIGTNWREDMGEWQVPQRVTEWTVERAFAWHTGSHDQPAAQWHYRLEKIPGGTRLRHLVTLGPGPSGLTRLIAHEPDREAAIIAHRQDELKTNMQATVDGIKALAEANRVSNQSGFPKLGSGGMRRRET